MGQGAMTELQLSLSAYEAVLNVVRKAGEARDPDGFSRVVVRELAKLVPSEWVVLNEIDLEGGQQRMVAEPGSFVVPPEIEPFLVEFADQHPLITYYTATAPCSILFDLISSKRGSTPKSRAIFVHCSAPPVTPQPTAVRGSLSSLIHRTN